MALFLLRAVLGLAVAAEGISYVNETQSAAWEWILGLACFTSGSLLLIGFLTPIAGTVASVFAIALAVSALPTCTPNLFDSRMAALLGLTMLLALLGLGPGAFSLDARLFGRREIIIPPPRAGADRS